MPKIKEPAWGLVELAVVYVGIFAISLVVGSWSSQILTGIGGADTQQNHFYLGFVIQFLATVLLVFLLTIVYHKVSWSELGFKWGDLRQYWRYGVIGGVALLVIVIGLSIPVSILNPQLEPQLYEEMLREVDNKAGFGFLLLMGIVLGPFSEELFFRGMIYPVMRKHLGLVGGLLVAGLLFGLAHWDLWRTIPLAVGGMGLCYIYEKTGSILVTTVAHGVWNGIMAWFIYLSLT